MTNKRKLTKSDCEDKPNDVNLTNADETTDTDRRCITLPTLAAGLYWLPNSWQSTGLSTAATISASTYCYFDEPLVQ